MNIALIAHDQKKGELIDFVKDNEEIFARHNLYGTGTTGKKVMENTNLEVTRFLSGPYGGDQQVGNLIAPRTDGYGYFFSGSFDSHSRMNQILAR